MKIWTQNVTIDELNQKNSHTIHESIGIQFIQIGDDFIEASMPVDNRTKNPIGILHGGASVVLAESLGSIASMLVAGSEHYICAGIEINASHLKSISEGFVIGRVRPIRIGRTLHVWDIQIYDQKTIEQNNPHMVCQCRLTVMVIKQSQK